MSDKNNPHIAGRYAILAALIGVFGTLGGIYLKDYLDRNKEEVKEKTEISNEKPKKKPISKKSPDGEMDNGIFTDTRDGQTYKWVRLKDGRKWMAQNLNFEINDSWCYDNDYSNCDKYGRLYTWEMANKACPSGWQLPSDSEWKRLANVYGGYSTFGYGNITVGNPHDSYKNLVKGGNSGFSGLLGGYFFYAGGFDHIDLSGNYWSSTEMNSSKAFGYGFKRYNKIFTHDVGDKSFARSCRCIQG